MYSRSTLRPERKESPAIPRGSSLTGNMPLPSLAVGRSPRASYDGIRSSNSMPDNSEFRQTYSGSLLVRRDRSVDEEQNRTRAQDLRERLELSNIRDLALNKASSYEHKTRMAPSLGGSMMNMKQWSTLSTENQQNDHARAERDPLRTECARLKSAMVSPRLDPIPSGDDPVKSGSFAQVTVEPSFDDNIAEASPTDVMVFFADQKMEKVPSSLSIPNDFETCPEQPRVYDLKKRQGDFVRKGVETTKSVAMKRVSRAENHVAHLDDAHPRRMTRGEKRAELARQTRERLSAAKSRRGIPELC